MAQGTDEASTLLERTKFLWDNVSNEIKAFIQVSLQKDNTKEYSFSNNSSMFIRVSFRSATLQRLHISEFGKIANSYPKRAREVKTGTLQALAAGNTGVILQSIDEEAATYFSKLEELTGYKLTVKQKNFWVAQRRELGSDILQEYPGTPEEAFMASKDGTYFSRIFSETCVRKNRVAKDLYDPNLKLYVFFDLGVDDYTVLIFAQFYKGEWKILDEYYNDGYAIVHYLDYIKNHKWSGNVYSLKFPHDIEVREQGASHSNGRAKKRRAIVQDYKRDNYQKWFIDVIPKGDLLDGIEHVRSIIPNMYIDPSCTYLISCINKYTKEWDEKLRIWKKTPRHDKYSHGADCLRQLATDRSFHYAAKSTNDNSIPQGGDV